MRVNERSGGGGSVCVAAQPLFLLGVESGVGGYIVNASVCEYVCMCMCVKSVSRELQTPGSSKQSLSRSHSGYLTKKEEKNKTKQNRTPEYLLKWLERIQ